MSQVFVSYAKEDRVRVAKLVTALEKRGWSVFWDREIPAGQTYATYIGTEASTADCLLVVWSKASIDADKHWIHNEAQEGVKRDVLLPVRIDDVSPQWGFRQFQARDLIGWSGDASAPEFHRLLADIERIVVSSSGGPAPEIWGKPGETVPRGIYEERNADGDSLPGTPRRIRVTSKSKGLPPTSKPGHWWTKATPS